MEQICKIKYGSHLYGTNLPQSDTDYKMVFWPSPQDILLCRQPNLSFAKTDNDVEVFSLHRFVEQALQGQTVAIEMLFAPAEQSSPEWDFLVQNRTKFLSCKLKAFSGYAKTQMSKYSTKAENLDILKKNIGFLHSLNYIDQSMNLVGLSYRLYYEEKRTNNQGFQEYKICNKWFAENLSIGHLLKNFERLEKKFGQRVLACQNGKDWKSIAHALRISQELLELCNFGQITFSRPNASYLKEIILGNIPYETVVAEIEAEFAKLSKVVKSLPAKPDEKFWHGWLAEQTLTYLLRAKGS